MFNYTLSLYAMLNIYVNMFLANHNLMFSHFLLYQYCSYYYHTLSLSHLSINTYIHTYIYIYICSFLLF